MDPTNVDVRTVSTAVSRTTTTTGPSVETSTNVVDGGEDSTVRHPPSVITATEATRVSALEIRAALLSAVSMESVIETGRCGSLKTMTHVCDANVRMAEFRVGGDSSVVTTTTTTTAAK